MQLCNGRLFGIWWRLSPAASLCAVGRPAQAQALAMSSGIWWKTAGSSTALPTGTAISRAVLSLRGLLTAAMRVSLFDSESGLLPLYQTLTTTPGTEYTISFMVEGFPQNASKVTVSWGGGPPIADLIDIPNAWTNYTFTETANSNSTQLTFGLADSSSGGFLDDIIVTSDVVPEPSSLAIFVVVLFGLGLTRRQRIRRAACRTEATRISKITEIAASAIQSITRARPGATI